MLPWILCTILLMFVVALLGKVYFLQKSLDEICTEFGECLDQNTNSLICTSSRDSHVRQLAARLNEELRKLHSLRRRFQNGDRELKEAVTNISHDLRTPLTALCGYLDLLEYEEKTETVQQYLMQIKNRTEAMKALTEELFRYSVVNSLQEEKRADVVLNRVLEESLAACYGALVKRRISPRISIPETKVHRNLDSSALSRIFENILSNVLKYSEGDLEVTLETEGRITFTNRTKNMTPVMAERLFDRFYTVETGRNSTGLGLSIAKLLAERMGGQIGAEYWQGKLSVWVCFPEEGSAS